MLPCSSSSSNSDTGTHWKRVSWLISYVILLVAGTLLLPTGTVGQNPECAAIERFGTPHRCPNSHCINASRLCDGANDCLDWSDEQDCQNQTCSDNQFKCSQHGNCINLHWKCDGDRDCSDGSDEQDCDTQRPCHHDEFRCSNGRCIPASYKCDGDNDCNDDNGDESSGESSDEKDCVVECREYQLMCQSGEKCISLNWRCDGEDDCDDGSDETNCTAITVAYCPIGDFDCRGTNASSQTTPQCVMFSWVCDGEADCDNGLDEQMCNPGITPPLCQPGQFACTSGECIPEVWRCDEDVDCVSGNDELNCDPVCHQHQFQCTSGECIDGMMVCNGHPDCFDSSDELVPTCENFIQVRQVCQPNQFQCTDFSRCLSGEHYCDNRTQCADGSDEQDCFNRHIDECQLDNGGCEQLCHDTPTSHFCSCHHGYQINSNRQTCDDVDECSVSTPCAQLCSNTVGNYTCSCVDGFVADGPHCHSQSGDAWLLYSNRVSLQHTSTDGQHNQEVVPLLNNSIAVDFHYRLGYVYWTDVFQKTIQRGYLNGSGMVNTVIGSGLEEPTGIAVDWITDKLYWTDSTTKVIEVSELDGSNRKRLFCADIDNPRPIVVDPFNRHIYWGDWGINARIERASMDGTQRTVIHGTRLIWPNALTIDLIGQRLYWADAKLRIIETSHLDGSYRQVLVQKVLHPFSIASFGNDIFYTDWEGSGVYRVGRLSGTMDNATRIVETAPVTTMGIKVVHPSLQQPGDNPCFPDNGGCSHLCLLSASSPGRTSCACPTGRRLDSNNKNCLPLMEYLLFTRSTDIRRISLDDRCYHDTVLPLNDLKYAVGLDWTRRRMVWCDVTDAAIYTASLEGTDKRVLTMAGPGSQLVDVAVDWVNDMVYWTDSYLDRIEVVNMAGTLRTVLVYTKLDKPRGLALHPLKGLMFWTDWGSTPKIERANMDGTNRSVIVSTNLAWPNGIAIDYERDMLYWVDGYNKSLEYCDFYGNNRGTLLSQMVLHPFGITVYKEHVYWTDWESRKLERVNKITGEDRLVLHSNLAWMMEVVVVHSNRPNITSNPCAINNGGCSDLCLLRASENDGIVASCACNAGLRLMRDNRTCDENPDTYLVFSVFQQLRKMTLNTANPVDMHINVSDVTNAVAIAVDPISEDIFWVDTNRILRGSQRTGHTEVIAHMTSTSSERFSHTGSTAYEGIALDWLGHKVYWTDFENRYVEVATYDGCVRSVLLTVKKGLSGPRAITLDIKNRYLFFVDWEMTNQGHRTVIKRSELDGSDLKVIVDRHHAGQAIDLAVDYQGDTTKLYWTNSDRNGNPSIISVDIDGGDRRVLLEGLTNPNGIGVTTDRVYWSTWNSGNISSVDKMTGSSMNTVIQFPRQAMGDISIFSSDQHEHLANYDYPCNPESHECSHLCLPNKGSRGYRCACSTGIVIDSNGNTCNKAPIGFLVLAQSFDKDVNGSLVKISLDTPGSYDKTTLLPGIHNPVALEYYHINNFTGYIFWSDPTMRFIGRVAFNGSDPTVIVQDVVSNSLAVDWIGGNLYWTEFEGNEDVVNRSALYVSRLDGSYKKKLLSTDLGRPRGITVYPKEGKIFWLDWSRCDASLHSSNMDGTDKQVILQLTDSKNCKTSWPNQLELDHFTNELLWVDGYLDKLQSVSVTGASHRVLLSNITYCFGLGLDMNGDVYYTSWNIHDYSLWRWNSHNSTQNVSILRNLPSRPMDVAVVRRDNRPSGIDDQNACAFNNGGCPYLCLPSNHTHCQCACPDNVESCTEHACPDRTITPSATVRSHPSTHHVSPTETIITPIKTKKPPEPPSSRGSSSDDFTAAFIVLAVMAGLVLFGLIMIIYCVVRYKGRLPGRFSPRDSSTSSLLAVYGRFRSRKLPEESQNGWTDKPNNYIDQLPTTKQLESAANGVCNSHPPPLVQKGRRSMKEMDGLCPKTINEKANNLNVNPGTPPSPQTPNEHEAMVRIEPAKVVYECKSSFV